MMWFTQTLSLTSGAAIWVAASRWSNAAQAHGYPNMDIFAMSQFVSK
jgi:hypothetical protein